MLSLLCSCHALDEIADALAFCVEIEDAEQIAVLDAILNLGELKETIKSLLYVVE